MKKIVTIEKKLILALLMLFQMWGIISQAQTVTVSMAGTSDVNGSYMKTGSKMVNSIEYDIFSYTSGGTGTTYTLDFDVVTVFGATSFYGWRIFDASTTPAPGFPAGLGTIYFSDGNSTMYLGPDQTTWSPGPAPTGGITPVPFAVVLPVELTRFTANPHQNKVQLNWQTASEINNDYFEVLRSNNNKDWEVIGMTNGAGTTLQTINYEFKDERPLKGDNYYQLRQVDYDGTATLSEVVSARIETDEISFEIYPNPVAHQLNIRLSEEAIDFPTDIYLIDAAGRQIDYLEVIDTKTSIDVSGLNKGFYFLQIRTENKIYNQRFLKQ